MVNYLGLIVCVCECVPMMGLGGTVTLRYHVDVTTTISLFNACNLFSLSVASPSLALLRSSSCSTMAAVHFTCMPASWSMYVGHTATLCDGHQGDGKASARGPKHCPPLRPKVCKRGCLTFVITSWPTRFLHGLEGCHTHKLCSTAALQ